MKLFYEFYNLYTERSHHSSIASPSSSIQQSNNNESITYLSDDNAPPVRSSTHRSSARSTRRSGVPRITHISGGNRNKSRKNKKSVKKSSSGCRKNKSYKKK
jgi:hypothetical protein